MPSEILRVAKWGLRSQRMVQEYYLSKIKAKCCDLLLITEPWIYSEAQQGTFYRSNNMYYMIGEAKLFSEMDLKTEIQ